MLFRSEATDFLVNIMGVINPSLLPSQNIYSILSYFFYLNQSRVKPHPMTKFYYPFRLSWRQLAFNKLRFLTAIVGVIFACVLVFMQLGFKDGLFDSATLLQRTLTGDLYIVHDQSEAIWRLVPFPRQRLYRVLSIPEIKSVTPLYVGQAPWKNPLNGINRTTLVFGINPDSEVYTIDGLTRENRDKLKIHGNILFDELSRPEFGPVQEMLLKGPFKVELNGMKVNVVGFVS